MIDDPEQSKLNAMANNQILSNRIEAYACAIRCERHNAHLKACLYRNDEPCACSKIVSADWQTSLGW